MLRADRNVSYYRARYYDPTAGRFLSEDPIEFVGGITLRYARSTILRTSRTHLGSVPILPQSAATIVPIPRSPQA